MQGAPANCDPDPDKIRFYLGQRDMKEKLYNTEELWVSIDAADNPPLFANKDEDAFQEASERFEDFKTQAGDWAYTSSWGVANPGGGRDKMEQYLVKSKDFTKKAVNELGKLITILKL